jgi:hypothetical protein
MGAIDIQSGCVKFLDVDDETIVSFMNELSIILDVIPSLDEIISDSNNRMIVKFSPELQDEVLMDYYYESLIYLCRQYGTIII